MKKQILALAAAFASAAFFTACDRKTDADRAEITTSEDILTNLDYDEAADLDEDEAVADRGGSGTCPTRTWASPVGTWPNTLTVDYGDNCVRPDGRVLKGKVIITQSDSTMRVAGATRTVTYENFFVDDVQVGGSKTLTNNGLNTAGLLYFTKVVAKTLTFPDGTVATWQGTKIRTWTEGQNTPLILFDDVWAVTGDGSGTNRDGDEFTMSINEPLIKRNNCRWISEGLLTWTRNGRSRTLDFGDGTCDRVGTLTLANGDTFTIRLRR